jgi:hypothetical protein
MDRMLDSEDVTNSVLTLGTSAEDDGTEESDQDEGSENSLDFEWTEESGKQHTFFHHKKI